MGGAVVHATVRYIVDEIDPAVTFYTERLGFRGNAVELFEPVSAGAAGTT